ncbi:uncharacterized protein LOC100836163 [Brachypodium distachyon]|uniref:uncharacterized protein LOC100836163 n=1 Tax=Brachypodium distachyon TaxID=15368 RepID=UPI000D0CE238|nr:uncharacterized protein LOC100836163 [Brachypodium distachyon]|eukprot:XP_003571963.2 uncharacterized protein LOC100836163 [Brachypodium distachyon]
MHLTMSSAEKRAGRFRLPRSTLSSRAHLDINVRKLWAWPASGDDDGLTRAESVLATLGGLLAEPRAAAALRAHGDDRILDVFLELADVCGSFGRALLALKQSITELRAVVQRRHGDATATVATALRARRRAEKEIRRLAAAIRRVSRDATVLSDGDSVTGIVFRVVADVAAATAAAPEAIFRRCAAMSPDVSAVAQSVPWLARLRVPPPPATNKVVSEMAAALESLEERIGEIKRGSEKVFRSLLRTRVSLLNIHSSF